MWGICRCFLVPLLFTSCVTSRADGSEPYIVAMTMSGNSMDIIGDALQSAVGWVDRVVLLDTGVTDNTLEIAKKVAGDKLIIKTMNWPGSFADARNQALKIAADLGGSWGVFLDTDERFVGNISGIKHYLHTTEADMVNMKHDSLSYQKPRFHRLPVKGAYVGPTHETFAHHPGATTAEINGVVFSELPKDKERLRHKAQRDVDMLTNYTAAHQSNARWFYYLGDAHATLNEHEKAVAAFHKCTNLRGWSEEGAWAMYRAAMSLDQLKQHDAAIDALVKGMSRHPAMPELPWYASYLCYKAGKHQHAAWWARLATAHDCYKGTCPARIGFQYPFAQYEGPYDMLRWSLRALGDSAGAADAENSMNQAKIKLQRDKRTAAATITGRTPADKGDVSIGQVAGAPLLGCSWKQPAKPRIAVGFTTAHRPELFKRTYLSFRLRCVDCDTFITDWYGVDDGSSAADMAAMKRIAPHIKWLQKPANQSGHVGSINALIDVAHDYDYFVWMEDDWYFIRDEKLITKAVSVMQGDPSIAQVLFNTDYKDTDHQLEAQQIAGGILQAVCGVQYVVHKYCGALSTPEHKRCSVPGKTSNYHWPHFALRPGVWSMAHMNKLGSMHPGRHFEHTHGLKLIGQGLKTAFLPDINAIHLGITAPWLAKQNPHVAEETYSKHGISIAALGQSKSAYELTGTSR